MTVASHEGQEGDLMMINDEHNAENWQIQCLLVLFVTSEQACQLNQWLQQMWVTWCLILVQNPSDASLWALVCSYTARCSLWDWWFDTSQWVLHKSSCGLFWKGPYSHCNSFLCADLHMTLSSRMALLRGYCSRGYHIKASIVLLQIFHCTVLRKAEDGIFEPHICFCSYGTKTVFWMDATLSAPHKPISIVKQFTGIHW